jgi:hypothetical protein
MSILLAKCRKIDQCRPETLAFTTQKIHPKSKTMPFSSQLKFDKIRDNHECYLALIVVILTALIMLFWHFYQLPFSCNPACQHPERQLQLVLMIDREAFRRLPTPTRRRPPVTPVPAPTPAPTPPPRHPRRWRFGRTKLRFGLIATAVVVALAAALLGYVILHRKPQVHDVGPFPAATVQEIKAFKLYYLSPSFSTDYVLQSSTIDYQAGVLVFEMKNPSGNTLAFTEEATPPGFDISGLNADKVFNTSYGQAFITDAVLRTTGALFTTNNTWILVNSPTPIGADLMEQILNNLIPIR